MTTGRKVTVRWYVGFLTLIMLGLLFVSCSDEGSNPIAPASDEQSDFVAGRGESGTWGAYYTSGKQVFYLNIPEDGAYQLEYAVLREDADGNYTKRGGPYFITFDTPEAAILSVGLLAGDILNYACVSSGTISQQEISQVDIKTSWKVTVYSVTRADGETVPWWTPSGQARGLFDSDGSDPVCAIKNGKVIVDEIDPPKPPSNDGGGNNGGGTPPGPSNPCTDDGGTLITLGTDDYCFVYGADGDGCDDACAAFLDYDDVGTEEAADDANYCETVASNFSGAPTDNPQFGGGAGYGCYAWIGATPPAQGLYRNTSATPGTSTAGARRFCACTPNP